MAMIVKMTMMIVIKVATQMSWMTAVVLTMIMMIAIKVCGDDFKDSDSGDHDYDDCDKGVDDFDDVLRA